MSKNKYFCVLSFDTFSDDFDLLIANIWHMCSVIVPTKIINTFIFSEKIRYRLRNLDLDEISVS